MKALDIVIGLVFIYFLYSLLITIIGEMVSSWIGMRARLLRQGIVNLLTDNSLISIPGIAFSKKDFRKSVVSFFNRLFLKFKKYLEDIFMIENKDFIFSQAGQFYDDQNIRSLAKGGKNQWFSLRNTKPSYISKQKFSDTIISILQRKGQGASVWDRIVFAIEKNTLNLDTATHQKLQDLLTSANGQYNLFIKKLEDSFDEMMDRVNGWYKRKLGFILFWLGMILCTFLNVDTFQIITTLSRDPGSRQDIVKLAKYAVQDSSRIATLLTSREDSIKNYQQLKESYNIAYNDIRQTENIMAAGWDFQNTSLQFFIDKNDSINLRKLEPEYKALYQKIGSLKKSMKENDYDVKTLKKTLDSIITLEDSMSILTFSIDTVLRNERNFLKKVFIPRLITIDKIDFENKLLTATASPGIGAKIVEITHRLSPFEPKLWGLSLTALALSLGANFWFDLLKKLVSLRGSGVKPEEKTISKEEQINRNALTNNGNKADKLNPSDILISENRKYWESLAGVIAINKGIQTLPGGKKTECVEIIVDKDYDYSKILVGNNEVTVNIITGEKALFNPGTNKTIPGNSILNVFTDSWGTPSGIVINKRTGRKALLSCGHVLKSDTSGYIKEDKNLIEFKNWNELVFEGKIVNLAMTNFLDCGIIEVKSLEVKDDFPVTINNFRNVTTEDRARKTEVKIHTIAGIVKGRIYDVDKNFMFSDGYNDYRMYDLIMIGQEDIENLYPLTKAGDSGALITAENDIPIGILIGAGIYNGRSYSFGVKISEIFDALYLKTVGS